MSNKQKVIINDVELWEYELYCPECSSLLVLKHHENCIKYHCSSGDCHLTHGAHPDGRPLGTPANKQTRKLRIEAHIAFDRLWKYGSMTRVQAYSWLHGIQSLPDHIGEMNSAQCLELIRCIRKQFPDSFPFDLMD